MPTVTSTCKERSSWWLLLTWLIEVGIDHAGQLGVWLRPAKDAQAAQSIMSTLHHGGGDHVDSSNGAVQQLLWANRADSRHKNYIVP